MMRYDTRNCPPEPEPIRLTAGKMTAKLFAGMRYVWACCYNEANYGWGYDYKFYHINRNIYLVDACDKKITKKLQKVFPIIDAWKDRRLLDGEPWKVFTPDACLRVYEHKDIFDHAPLMKKERNIELMQDEAWYIICALSPVKDIQPLEINKHVFEHWEYVAKQTGKPCIYVGNENERYILGEPGKRNILIFGINPSTATYEKYDRTINRVRRILQEHPTYDGWLMVNLHPQVTPYPENLVEYGQWHDNNLDVLHEVWFDFRPEAIWCAWGGHIAEQSKSFLFHALFEIYEMFRDTRPWLYYGTLTKDGHPRHPLQRDPKHASPMQEFSRFDVETYLLRHGYGRNRF